MCDFQFKIHVLVIAL